MISPTAEYALRAMLALGRAEDRPLITSEIAEVTLVPASYLSKVLQTLARADLVQSQRGLGGGFKLTRPADEISVLEVIDAVDPIKRIKRCPLGIADHKVALCPLHQSIDDAAAAVEQTFANLSITSLINQSAGNAIFCERRKKAGRPERKAATKQRKGSSK